MQDKLKDLAAPEKDYEDAGAELNDNKGTMKKMSTSEDIME